MPDFASFRRGTRARQMRVENGAWRLMSLGCPVMVAACAWTSATGGEGVQFMPLLLLASGCAISFAGFLRYPRRERTNGPRFARIHLRGANRATAIGRPEASVRLRRSGDRPQVPRASAWGRLRRRRQAFGQAGGRETSLPIEVLLPSELSASGW